jgi:predicted transcriptional regulator
MSSLVSDVMTHNVVSVRERAQFEEIILVMRARGFSPFRLPVVTTDGTLVGVVSRVDLLGVYDYPDSEIQNEIIKRVIDDEFVLDSRAFTVTRPESPPSLES